MEEFIRSEPAHASLAELGDMFGTDDWQYPVRSHPLSLRFLDPALEAEFLHTRMGELASVFFGGGTAVFALFTFLLTDGGEGSDQPAPAAAELLLRRQAVLGTAAAFGALAIVLSRAPRILESARPMVFEICATLATLVLTVAVYYAEPYYIAKLHGHDPASVFTAARREQPLHFSDTRLLLCVDGIVTASHLLLPIRWCVVWPVDCALVLLHAILVVLVGSPERGRAMGNLLLLAALCSGSLLGKRRLEYHERLAFGMQCPMSQTGESFEAEMPLSDLSTSGHSETGAVRRAADDECSVPSAPTTTHTGRMFAELERVDSEVRWKLERIAEIGHKERWLIEACQVRLMPKCILGSGSFGVVVLASLHGSKVAVKVPRSSVNGSTAWHLPSLGNELRILRHVRHPNVVLFHGACIDPISSELALVLEHVQGQRLDRFLEAHQSELACDAARHRILVDICCALRYLHGQRPCVVHGDLKASNILVEDWHVHPRPKLVDFGLSRLLTRKAKPLGGTLNWMAPELLQNPCMSPAPSADVFSFGRLAYFVTTSIRPLADIDRRTLVKMARKARVPALLWPEGAPYLEECQALAHRCLEVDAGMRPSMVEVHHDLVRWQPADELIEYTGSSPRDVDSLPNQDKSLSWRSGLRMVRESLRPVPPNRPGQESPPVSPTMPRARGHWSSSEEVGGVSSGDPQKPLRWERPLPPPRPQGQQAPRVRPTLPKLPPVLEGEWESTTKHDSPVTEPALPLVPSLLKTEPEEPAAAESDSAPCTTLVLPEFRETPSAMMEIGVIDAIQRWNFHRPASSCCVWHAALARLGKVHRNLKNHPCSTEFSPVKDWQCPRCLHMDQLDPDISPEEKECDLCGYDPEVKSNPDDDDEGELEDQEQHEVNEEDGHQEHEEEEPNQEEEEVHEFAEDVEEAREEDNSDENELHEDTEAAHEEDMPARVFEEDASEPPGCNGLIAVT